MEFLSTFKTRGHEYELYKNHITDTFYVGSIGCDGTGLKPCIESPEGLFIFRAWTGRKLEYLTVPKRTINSGGSL